MSKFICFRLIFLLTTVQAFAVEIKGKVLNLGGLPIVKAEVLHRSSGIKTSTDVDGLFSLNVPQDEKFTSKSPTQIILNRKLSLRRRIWGKG